MDRAMEGCVVEWRDGAGVADYVSITSSWEDDPTAAADIKVQLQQLQGMIMRKERDCKDAEHRSRLALVEARERLRFSEGERERLAAEIAHLRGGAPPPALDPMAYVTDAAKAIRAEFEAEHDQRLADAESMHAQTLRAERGRNASYMQELRAERAAKEAAEQRLSEGAGAEDLRRRLAAEEARSADLAEQLCGEASRADALQQQLSASDTAGARQKDRIAALETRVETLGDVAARLSEAEKERDAAAGRLDALTGQLTASDATAAALSEKSKELDELAHRLQLAEAAAARRDVEESALKAALALERDGAECVKKNTARQLAEERKAAAAQRDMWHGELVAEREAMTRLMDREAQRQRDGVRQEYDAQVESLQAEVERLRSEASSRAATPIELTSFAGAEQQLQRAESEIASLASSLAAAKEEADTAKRDLEARMSAYRADLAATAAPHGDVEKQLRDANVELTEQNIRLRNAAADAARRAEGAEAALEEKAATVSRLEAAAAANLQRHRDEMAARDIECQAAVAQIHAVTDSREKLTVTEWDARVAALRRERDALAEKTAALPAFEATIEEMTSRLAALLTRVTDLEEALKVREREGQDKESIIRLQRDELAAVQEELRQHREITAARTQHAGGEDVRQAELIRLFEGELSIHQSKLESLQAALRSRQEELDASAADIQDVRREADAVRAENALLRQQITDAKAKWQAEVAERVALQTQHAHALDAVRDSEAGAARRAALLEDDLAAQRQHAASLQGVLAERDALETDTRRREREVAAGAVRGDVARLEEQLRTKTDQLLLKDRKEEAIRAKLAALLGAILPPHALADPDPAALALARVKAWRAAPRRIRATARRHYLRWLRLRKTVRRLRAQLRALHAGRHGLRGSRGMPSAYPAPPLSARSAHAAGAHATPPTVPRIPLPTKTAETPCVSPRVPLMRRSDTAEVSLSPRPRAPASVDRRASTVDEIEAVLDSIQSCIAQPLPGAESRTYSPARPTDTAVPLSVSLPPPPPPAPPVPVRSPSPTRPATSAADVMMAAQLLEAHETSRRRREGRADELQQLVAQLDGELRALAAKEAELQVHKERTVATIDAQNAALAGNQQFWRQQLTRREAEGAVGEAARCREKLRQTEEDLHALAAQRPELLAKAEQGHLGLTREVLKLHEQREALEAERRHLLAESGDLRGKEALLRAVVESAAAPVTSAAATAAAAAFLAPPPAAALPPPVPTPQHLGLGL